LLLSVPIRFGRNEARKRRQEIADELERLAAAIVIQKNVRGMFSRQRVAKIRARLYEELVLRSTIALQRVLRGFLGRIVASNERSLLELKKRRHLAAINIQRQVTRLSRHRLAMLIPSLSLLTGSRTRGSKDQSTIGISRWHT
jgi:hypothetical protein